MKVHRFGRLTMQVAFGFSQRAKRCQRAAMHTVGKARIGHDLRNNRGRTSRRRCFCVHMNFRAGNT